MFPTKLGMALAAKYDLVSTSRDPEGVRYIIGDAVAEVQAMAAAGSSFDEILMVFEEWMADDSNGKKRPRFMKKHREGIQKIIDTTLAQVNGHVIKTLSDLTDKAVNDKERVAATQLLHAIMNGEDVEANASAVANLIVTTRTK